MATDIITKVKPLYDELIRIGFNSFVKDKSFVRVCNAHELTDVYTDAHNKVAKKDTLDFINFDFTETSDLLAEFLNCLYMSSAVSFAKTVSKLIVDFLKTTDLPVYQEHVIEDLKALGLSDSDSAKLSTEFSRAQNNYLNKARYIKQLMISRATGGGGDEVMYERLRNDFVKSTTLKAYIPQFFYQCATLDDFWQFIKAQAGQYQARRVFLNNEFTPLIVFLERDRNAVVEIVKIDNIYIQDTWKKALDRLNHDPEGAITSARTLLEAVCKYILESDNDEYDENIDLPKLYKTVAKKLQLSPDQHTEQIFKQILGGCQSIVDGLGSLRNKLSDAHGKGVKAVKPQARHASLAVNLAGAMCQFLLQTFDEKIGKQK